MWFTILSLSGFILSLLFCGFVKKIALKKGIVDDPRGNIRKIHKNPIPFLGGVGIYLAFTTVLSMAFYFDVLPQGTIAIKHVIGLILGGCWLIIGGIFDDIYDLSPKFQMIAPILAVITVIICGIGIESMTNPLGGQWFLDQKDIYIFHLRGIPYKITLLADIFTFIWMMAVMYALKIFDGLDGLVSGITVIGSLVIYFISLLPKINQPETALIAIIVAACFAGFLVLNFHPAQMFLGESGSLLAGFLVGSLAIISESKVVTTLVVMSLPILDLIWIIIRRVIIEKKPFWRSDKKHIHHRLLDSGFSHRQSVMVLYLWAGILGFFAWLYQGYQQYIVLLVAVICIGLFAFYLVKKTNR